MAGPILFRRGTFPKAHAFLTRFLLEKNETRRAFERSQRPRKGKAPALKRNQKPSKGNKKGEAEIQQFFQTPKNLY